MPEFPLPSGNKLISSGEGTTTNGTLVSSSATAHTMGSIVELDASTVEESSWLTVTLSGFSVTGVVSFLFDILIGPTGQEEMLVQGIHAESPQTTSAQSVREFEFPINIPKGARISARCQSDTAATDGVRLFIKLGSPTFSSHPGFGRCVSHGFNKSTTNGTVVDPGAVANAKGSYVELASTNDGYSGFTISVGANQNDAQGNGTWEFDVAVGAAGQEEVVAPDIFHLGGSNERGTTTACFYEVAIPKGARIAIRAASSQTNSVDRIRSVVFHGVK